MNIVLYLFCFYLNPLLNLWHFCTSILVLIKYLFQPQWKVKKLLFYSLLEPFGRLYRTFLHLASPPLVSLPASLQTFSIIIRGRVGTQRGLSLFYIQQWAAQPPLLLAGFVIKSFCEKLFSKLASHRLDPTVALGFANLLELRHFFRNTKGAKIQHETFPLVQSSIAIKWPVITFQLIKFAVCKVAVVYGVFWKAQLFLT